MANQGTGKAVSRATRQAKREAKNVKREAQPWVVRLARLGYASKGIVYILIGLLAFNAAQGAGSPNVDKHRAMATILTQPFGQILLAVIAIGLAGYALWRIIQAIVDPENAGSDAGGLARRVGYAAVGISYLGLALFATQLIRSGGGSGSDSQMPRDWTARLMAMSVGPWIVVLAGVLLVGLGLYQLYSAYKAKFEKNFKTREMSSDMRRRTIELGRFGYAAIGVVSLLLGSFLIQAAIQHNPNKAGGLSEALQALASQPYGSWLLAIVALGLVAYGIYAVALARYRRIYL